jgi:nicotinamidase-related amidase
MIRGFFVRTASYVNIGSLEQKTTRWLDQVRDSVPERSYLLIDPSRCALLVIDMVQYFADPAGRCFLPATEAIRDRIGLLLEAWRGQGSSVVFTRHGHRGDHDLGMLGRFFSDYIRAEEPESEIIDALAPQPDEVVFRKTTYDAFLNTPLESLLTERGITQVLITGVLTHMCCETTARAAFCRGFEVYVPADATASHCEERHLGSLSAMADSVAVILSTEEILRRCETSK